MYEIIWNVPGLVAPTVVPDFPTLHHALDYMQRRCAALFDDSGRAHYHMQAGSVEKSGMKHLKGIMDWIRFVPEIDYLHVWHLGYQYTILILRVG